MPSLTAVVPATNSPPTLARCLAALSASTAPPEEVIVISEPPFAGPAEARNLGAARAQGDVVVFVDADVVVASDAFARIRARFDDDARLDAVFGSYDDVVATRRLTAAFRNLLHHHVHHRAPGPATTFWAGLGAVRRTTFAANGGFDAERFARPSVEDIELGLRLTDRGASIVLDPSIRGTHLKDWTLPQMWSTDLCRRGIPWVRLLAERGGGSTALNLGWRDRASALVAVASALSALRGRPLRAVAAAAGLVALNRGLYALLRRRLGVFRATACVPLHVLHHLAAALAVPAGLLAHVVSRRLR